MCVSVHPMPSHSSPALCCWRKALTRAHISTSISTLGTSCSPRCKRSQRGTDLLLQLLLSGFILPAVEAELIHAPILRSR